MTVTEAAETWLERIKGTVARNTWASYRSIVQTCIRTSAFGLLAIVAVMPQDVRDFLMAEFRRGRAPGSIQLTRGVVALIFEDAVNRGLRPTNPARRLWTRMPPELRVRADPDRFTPPPGATGRIMAEVAKHRPRIGWVVATYQATGCRRNEALGLQVEDIDFHAATLTIRRQWHGAGRIGPPKGRRPRTIDLSESLEPVLREAIEESEHIARLLRCEGPRWVFRAPQTGVPWSPAFVGRTISAASAEVCGEKFGPRAIRHAVATKLIHAGETPRYVQLLLGHQHLTTTMVYVAHRGLRRRSAVNRLRDL